MEAKLGQSVPTVVGVRYVRLLTVRDWAVQLSSRAHAACSSRRRDCDSSSLTSKSSTQQCTDFRMTSPASLSKEGQAQPWTSTCVETADSPFHHASIKATALFDLLHAFLSTLAMPHRSAICCQHTLSFGWSTGLPNIGPGLVIRLQTPMFAAQPYDK